MSRVSRGLRLVASLLAGSLVVGACGAGEGSPTPDAGSSLSEDSSPKSAADVGQPLPDAGDVVDAGGTADAGVEDDHDAGARGALAPDRERLLDTLPGGRCAAWAGLDDDQRAVFLLVTDLLGKRTLLEDGASALSHVTRVHALRGRRHEGCLRCCGDREFNRAYLSMDDALTAACRGDALAAWRDTRDVAGPHTPFTASRETDVGQPRGQAHFFATDDDAVTLARPGVEDVLDPHALELDLDFNLLHESAPTCEYGGESGVSRYQELWGAQGAAGDAELTFAPEGC